MSQLKNLFSEMLFGFEIEPIFEKITLVCSCGGRRGARPLPRNPPSFFSWGAATLTSPATFQDWIWISASLLPHRFEGGNQLDEQKWAISRKLSIFCENTNDEISQLAHFLREKRKIEKKILFFYFLKIFQGGYISKNISISKKSHLIKSLSQLILPNRGH